MEATTKKRKNGGWYLKEKIAKLEKQLADMQKEKEILVQTAQDNYLRLEKERDEWKAKYEKVAKTVDACTQSREYYREELIKTEREYLDKRKDMQDRIAFLLNHCPFWVRWMYNKQFRK